MTAVNELPVAIVGAGPIGLAAAAHLVTRGLPVKLYESGDAMAANVRGWGHVRLFSPWRFNTDSAQRRSCASTAGRHRKGTCCRPVMISERLTWSHCPPRLR
jgi:glycine/D-amino acid oxidase-like deaminating enzyme